MDVGLREQPTNPVRLRRPPLRGRGFASTVSFAKSELNVAVTQMPVLPTAAAAATDATSCRYADAGFAVAAHIRWTYA